MEHTERDSLVRLSQKLDDHIVQQNGDMGEVKNSLVRIETKLYQKVSKDEVDRVALGIGLKADAKDVQNLVAIASDKVDKETLTPIKDKLDILDNRFWYIFVGVLMALLGVVLNFIFNK